MDSKARLWAILVRRGSVRSDRRNLPNASRLTLVPVLCATGSMIPVYSLTLMLMVTIWLLAGSRAALSSFLYGSSGAVSKSNATSPASPI